MEKKIVIAIDGYSGCGKSSTAQKVAQVLGYIYIDSGAMYRAITLYCIENEINLENTAQIEEALNNIHINFEWNPEKQRNDIYLDDRNIEKEIRKMYVSDKVSEVSKIHEVRVAMVAQQQRLGQKKGVVMDGRDIGTMVFPDAELKIFMTSDIKIRAKRRQLELEEKGDKIAIESIIENLQKRDLIDTTRTESPLRKAEDAFELDSSFITFEQQADYVIQLAKSKIKNDNTIINSDVIANFTTA
ncbi:MAG: (d)CMP kinase [Cytophagia bacterium]|nr:MAG: (d)CMP kinase [Cytophagales bacterium]TAG02106.1 MAG: (d)CMP kinase [Cytophagia bacterium]TAG43463.1 MAG: (d)CMP kinase [Cytophagia bacterium]TAH28719.1 MAG: (d)CMP kinase [Cytophagales bacterium]